MVDGRNGKAGNLARYPVMEDRKNECETAITHYLNMVDFLVMLMAQQALKPEDVKNKRVQVTQNQCYCVYGVLHKITKSNLFSIEFF